MAQNQCIFEYCNFGKGYLKIFFPEKKNNAAKEIMIDLEDYSMENGVITKIEPLVDRIKFELKKLDLLFMPSILLLLRCEETYRTTLALPVKNGWQAKMLYNKEMKARANKDEFYTVNNSYKRTVGYTFNTYYMPKNIVESFLKIAKQLGTEIGEAMPYGMYLCDSLDYDNNYVFFHIRRKVCTMILSSERNLITSYDFEFENTREILNKFLLVASKHEFEFDRKKITHYGISADDPIDFKLGLSKLGDASVAIEAPKKTELEQSMAQSIQQKTDELEVDWENYDDDTTIFSKRYADANAILRNRYDAISKVLLSYTGMKCRITEQSAVFHINSEVYARMDIRNARVMLYLATNPEKYINSRYPCALTKRKGFDGTPCLYRIATAFRQEGAFTLIEDLVTEKGLVPKPEEE